MRMNWRSHGSTSRMHFQSDRSHHCWLTDLGDPIYWTWTSKERKKRDICEFIKLRLNSFPDSCTESHLWGWIEDHTGQRFGCIFNHYCWLTNLVDPTYMSNQDIYKRRNFCELIQQGWIPFQEVVLETVYEDHCDEKKLGLEQFPWIRIIFRFLDPN